MKTRSETQKVIKNRNSRILFTHRYFFCIQQVSYVYDIWAWSVNPYETHCKRIKFDYREHCRVCLGETGFPTSLSYLLRMPEHNNMLSRQIRPRARWMGRGVEEDLKVIVGHRWRPVSIMKDWSGKRKRGDCVTMDFTSEEDPSTRWSDDPKRI